MHLGPPALNVNGRAWLRSLGVCVRVCVCPQAVTVAVGGASAGTLPDFHFY